MPQNDVEANKRKLLELQNKAMLQKMQGGQESPDIASEEELSDLFADMPEEDKPWYKDAYDMLMGFGKGAIKDLQFYTPTGAALRTYLSMRDQKPISEVDKVFYPTKGDLMETIGAGAVDIGAFATPAKGEITASKALEAPISKLPQLLQGPARVGANAAIGGASGAGVAALKGEEDPLAVGMWSAAFPGLAALLRETGVTPAIGGWLKSRAQRTMAKAIEPGTKADKWATQYIIDPLLESGKPWLTRKGMVNRAEGEIAASAARREAVKPGQGVLVSWDDVQESLRSKIDKAFRRGRAGGRIEAGLYQPGTVPIELGREDVLAGGELQKFIDEYLMPKTVIDESGNRWIPFDELDKAKRFMQNRAGLKNAFLGVPDESLSARMSAYKEGSNTLRPLLEDVAGDAWAKENEVMSTWYDILKLAGQAETKHVGRATPLAERPFIGFGAHMGYNKGDLPVDKSVIIRTLRLLTDTPAWNSLSAISQYNVAKMISENTGFKIGQIAGYLKSGSSEQPEENYEWLDQYLPGGGKTATIDDPLGLSPYLK